MSSVASVLSATAASIAAVLTAINLYVTGRRERAKWAREALVDAFIAFLDESFKAKDLCKTVVAWSVNTISAMSSVGKYAQTSTRPLTKCIRSSRDFGCSRPNMWLVRAHLLLKRTVASVSRRLATPTRLFA